MSAQPAVIRGSCACKALSWSSARYPFNVIYCWCRACRKRSGAPFIPFGDLFSSETTWSPADKLKKHKATHAATEFACTECNSTLAIQYPFSKEITSIVLGSIWCPDSLCCAENAARMDLRPRAHVYTSQKCSWFAVPDDGAPRYANHTPFVERNAEEWRALMEKETVRKRR